MTLVNHETGEIVESLTVDDARRLTDRIRLLATSVADSLDKLAGMIDEARMGSAWLALGYRSWTEYVSQEFVGILPRLDREPRQEFVRDLAASGMSLRSIAPLVGVSKDTVQRDLAGVSSETPDQAPEPAAGGEAVTGSGQTPEGEEYGEAPAAKREDPEPRPPVTGIDGKTYQRPTPRPAPTVDEDQWSRQDKAEELARNLARNLSLLYALTNAERRAEYIATWADGTRDLKPLGSDFITPTHMRDLADALRSFASEWENAHA